MWHGLTVAGRISGRNYNPNEGSDLSLHLHYKVPFIPRRWFDLALGIQDVGGAISYYDAYYLVASRAFGPLNLTLGLGHGSELEKRGHGLLGALSWQPLSFLRLGTEWNGDALNASARLESPPAWLQGRIKLGAQGAFTRITSDPDFYASAYVQMSLASSPPQPLARARPLRSPRRSLSWGRFPPLASPRPLPPQETSRSLQPRLLSKIRRELLSLDLERVRMAASPRGLRICVENAVFERSSIDAMGVVLGIASKSLAEDHRIELTITKNGVPVMTATTRSQAFAAMIDHGPTRPGLVRTQAGALHACPHDKTPGPSPFGRPRLSLEPIVATTVATERGYLDAHVGLRWGLELPLAYGSILRVRYQHALWHSEDFASDRLFHPMRLYTGFHEAALHQAFPIAKGFLGLFSAGLFDINRWTSSLHLRYQRGIHTVSAFASAFTLRFRQAYWTGLGQYRIEWPGGPTALTLTAGHFPDQSQGLRAALDVAWGDTVLSAYFRYGNAKAIGVGLTVPLAPRKNRIWGSGKARALVSSSPAFAHALHTRVGAWHNLFVGKDWLVPKTAFAAMGELYSEKERLTESRAAFRQERMRDAYYRFVKQNKGHSVSTQAPQASILK